MPSPTLATRVTRLASALRAYADYPFAASLAERLDEVLVAPDTGLAARELLGPEDLAGIEHFRPGEEAWATLVDVVCGDLAPHADARVAPLGVLLQPVLWSLAAMGVLWLGWVARAFTAAPR